MDERTRRELKLRRWVRKQDRQKTSKPRNNSDIIKNLFKFERKDYWIIKEIPVCPLSRSMEMFPLIEKTRRCLHSDTSCSHPNEYEKCILYLAWKKAKNI